MKRNRMQMLLLGAVPAVLAFAWFTIARAVAVDATATGAQATQKEAKSVALNVAKDRTDEIVARFRRELGESAGALNSMSPIPMQPRVLPGAGIDIMRVTLEEHYSIDGIGDEVVQLKGWIMVKHTNARRSSGAKGEPTWDDFVVDTEFVDLDLRGESSLFGPVRVQLDTGKKFVGRVGNISLPDEVLLQLAQLESATPGGAVPLAAGGGVPPVLGSGGASSDGEPVTQVRPTRVTRRPIEMRRTAGGEVLPAGGPALATTRPTTRPKMRAEDLELKSIKQRIREEQLKCCRALVSVNVQMERVGLNMRTERPVTWYSIVETVPPVGHSASIACDQAPLLDHGRRVGTLNSGRVRFREVVRHAALTEATPALPPPADSARLLEPVSLVR